jgi:hypothetical protein
VEGGDDRGRRGIDPDGRVRCCLGRRRADARLGTWRESVNFIGVLAILADGSADPKWHRRRARADPLVPCVALSSYKAIGYDNVDENGSVDTNEQFNLSHDDMLAYPRRPHGQDYPEPVKQNVDKVLRFTSGAHAVTMYVSRLALGPRLPD